MTPETVQAKSGPPPSLTDEEVAFRVQEGDAEAFGALVGRYTQKLLRYARKFLFADADAEDLVQDVFVKAYVNIKDFDAGRKFSSWIYRIAHNEFVNALKKKSRAPMPFFDPDTLFPHPLSTENPARDMYEREARAMVEACLDKLDPKYREAVVLYYYEQMDYREIADVLRIPISTVGVRLRRAKDRMRKLMEKDR